MLLLVCLSDCVCLSLCYLFYCVTMGLYPIQINGMEWNGIMVDFNFPEIDWSLQISIMLLGIIHHMISFHAIVNNQVNGKNSHITSNISEYPGPILTYFTGLVDVYRWRRLSQWSFGSRPRNVAMATS